MRQRHTVRPTLEVVEDRLVLSSAGVHASTHAALARQAADHAHASPARAIHHTTAQAATSKAHAHPAETTGHRKHKSSSSSSNSLSSLILKSLFPPF